MNGNPEQSDTAMRQEYRFVAVCKECGAVDETHVDGDRAPKYPESVEIDPAYQHYDRTGHLCANLNYTNAPYSIQCMIDDGRPESMDWGEVMEWLG